MLQINRVPVTPHASGVSGPRKRRFVMKIEPDAIAAPPLWPLPSSSLDPPPIAVHNPQPTTASPLRPSPLAPSSPVPWPEAVCGERLLDELTRTLTRFVVLPGCAAETLALWLLHTYACHLRDVTTYIGIESGAHRCGKTTLLTALSDLANRAVVASNVSPPALFRVIEELQPTLLIDEADTFLHANEPLRGILNSGYTRKTAFVLRVIHQPGNHAAVPGDQMHRLASFSCWCPKAIARIGYLPQTLADRCIVLRMQRKTSRQKCERLRHLQPESLKRQCARFVLDHADTIAEAEPDLPPELNDRAADIWD
jgi:putative DNA primase/helicase